MAIYCLDPLKDPRWEQLLQHNHRASVFHTPGWLAALQRTYGYEPVVLTTCNERQELTNGVVFCRVNSWLTGRRLVSLPFSDHCEPLASEAELAEILDALVNDLRNKRCKYVEVRPLSTNGAAAGMSQSERYHVHKIDLRPTEDELFRNLHPSCMRRQVQRSRREEVRYEKGKGPNLLREFYDLFVITRGRHGIPPSPFQWFLNLVECLGNKVEIRIARKNGEPIAGTVSLNNKTTAVYKYGASNTTGQKLGAMPLLLWNTIAEAKAEGRSVVDLGRSDLDNEGLVTFKDRLGSVRQEISYWRYPPPQSRASTFRRGIRVAKTIFERVPDRIRIEIGNHLYRHLG